MVEKTQDKKVDVELTQIELPKIDVTKYIGKKVKIADSNIYQGQFGLYLKVETETLETIGTGDNKKEIRASKILGIQQDADGIYGYGEGTKLDLFLKKMKVTDHKDLKGKIVIVQTQTSKDGTDFLSF